jgi:transcriptional regulator with XRE-family HTH domain
MLHKALRLIRVFHDMSQAEVAAKLNIAKSYLSEIESGKKAPTLQLLEGYSRAFGISMSSILFFSEHMDDGRGGDRMRLTVSKKVLALLDFIAARSEPADG